MTLLADLSERSCEAEMMDDPALDAAQHDAALRGLARLNRAAGAAHLLWPTLREESLAAGARPLRVLDIATGSGDVPLALAKRAQRAGRRIQIDGCDISPRAVETAQRRAAKQGPSDSTFMVLDAVNDVLPTGYDVLMCSLFMHHLKAEQVVDLLYRMRCAAARLVLVSDLERSRAGLALAWGASRLLTRSRVVHTDAVLSVRSAFSLEEFEALATEGGMKDATIRRCWPFRILLIWRRT